MENLNPMDLREIQNLIKFVARSGASEVRLETGDFKITIKTGGEVQVVQGVQALAAPVASVAAAPVAPAPVAAAPAAPASAPATEATGNYVTIKSPMIGTFYRKPSPDKASFVNVGDEIKAGSVVCVIEAMKLFNEIESEVSGRIVKVLVEDQSPVEYDQPLFLVEPA
jgi:acetyl-CoA carboxylase biotin carboxyl carrier protein